MKTKIIYISGSELFDIADIRAAFDTVREALALDKNTILFGVPVDGDDALAKTDIAETKPIAQPAKAIIETPAATVDTIEPESQPIEIKPAIVDEPAVIPSVTDALPEKPKKSSRKKVVPIVPDVDTAEPEMPSDDKPEQTAESVIPILSVLETKSEQPAIEDSISPEPETNSESVDIKPINIVTHSENTEIAPDTEAVTITDMIADESTPVDNHEKTLEELLESMTPLGEAEDSDTDVVTVDDTPELKSESSISANDDATLELLAAEFAETEDKIVTPKIETRSKIGKLKNILPFKKAKSQDPGLMGDLFGWAGVANDEDFTIPGFFANASSKK